jgi:hypothetical protein
MAEEHVEKKLFEVSKSHVWKFLKKWMEEEAVFQYPYASAEDLGDFKSSRAVRDFIKEIIRKIEGAEEALSFKGRLEAK